MQFEWDEAKAARNLARREIDFQDALEVFYDPLQIEFEDDRFDYGERRLITVGMAGKNLLSVVFTERETDEDVVVRIISARKANAYEQRTYRQGHTRRGQG